MPSRTAALFASYESAFQRMPKRERLRADQLTDRARHLLEDRIGKHAHPPHAGFAHVGFGLFAQHTCFVDGSAALLSLSQGTAVCLRHAEVGASEIVGEDPGQRFVITPETDASSAAPVWVRLIIDIWRRVAGQEGSVQAAVVTTVFPTSVEPYLASLAVATMRAVHLAQGLSATTPIPYAALCTVISELIDGPYSVAYLMAADADSVDTIVLVNTLTAERRNVAIPGGDSICWGIVDVGSGAPMGEEAYRNMATLAQEALVILKDGPHRDLRSLALLDFKALHRALASLPKRLRPVVRFLVGESHRAHHLDTALRRSDWQVVGGLLFFSHASLRDEWAGTNAEIDFVVETVESRGGDGMYGACLTGRGGCVLVVGQRYAVPACVERIKEGFMERFGREPRAMLL
jgi:galactokinase